jgi:DNA-binding NarL/FixJ family response regulator
MTRTTGVPQGDTQERTLVALSPREEAVVRLVSLNRSNGEIAQEFRVTEKTVEGYICRLYQGLGLTSRAELLLWGRQNARALSDRRAVPTGLHPIGCACGSGTCADAALLDLAA